MRKVVITGLSLCTPLGSLSHTFESLLSGQCGIQELSSPSYEQFDDFPVKVAGIVSNPDLQSLIFTSAKEAYDSAGLSPAESMNVLLGCDKSSFAYLHSQNPSPKSDFLSNYAISHYLSGLSTLFNTKGFCSSIAAGLATGQASIIEAAKLIKHGRADIVLAGAVEPDIDAGVMMSLYKAGYLSREGEINSCKPFDMARDGFIYSSGAGWAVVESLESALNRRAKIFCEISGFSSISHKDPKTGVFRVMDQALKNSGISKQEIDVFNCDAAGVKSFDEYEARYIEGSNSFVTSHKGNIGHMISASGVIQTAISCLMIDQGEVPPILNLVIPSIEELNYVCKRQKGSFNHVLSNSFSYDSGIYTSIVFKRFS